MGVIQEMVMFVESGITPMQAIQAGTINVAKSFRKDKDFGTVEPGRAADLIAVKANPLEDISALRNVAWVMKEGRVVKNQIDVTAGKH